MKTIHPADIAAILDGAPASVKILSLDCFDTLIWRATHLPQDVFTELDPTGGGIAIRVDAEVRARRRRSHASDSTEVSIEAIHDELSEVLGADSVSKELALEARHCYAFAPIVALIDAAKARALSVVVVSDTYLNEAQLRRLIADVAGDTVAARIDRIFCSSTHGRGKAGGLFDDVVAALGVPPASILHIGDNRVADGTAADAAGLLAFHIEQFDEATATRLRLEAAAAIMAHPALRASTPVFQLHRAAMALAREANPTRRFGHDVVGPLIDAFAHWIAAEVEDLSRATGRPVRPVFLLRDGYLPKAVYEAIGGTGAAAVSISRFTARRSSLTDAAAIQAYLDEEPTQRVSVLGAQLGLRPEELAKIGEHHAVFRRNVLAPDVVERIVRRSAAFAKRLAAHVARESRIQAGDIVMLVDLGYRGTVQDLSTRVIKDALGVDVVGRYLLLTDVRRRADKRGMFDIRTLDHRLLAMLSRQIAVVEQVATCDKGSVIDYADNGRSIHKPNRVGRIQAETRAVIQAGAIAFARTATTAMLRPPASDRIDGRRYTALGVLTRLLFLPQPDEIALLETFQHDVNLGTNDMVGLIDRDGARVGLRRRGLPYLRGVERMFLPGELQSQGLPLSLSLLAANRFELDLRTSDFQVAHLTVPAMVADARQQTMSSFDAHATHDGYHALAIPVGEGRFGIGLQLGAIADIVQIDEVSFYTLADYSHPQDGPGRAIATQPVYDAMDQLAEGVWRTGGHSLLFVPPPPQRSATPLMLSVVFRVIAPPKAMVLKAAA